MHFGQYLIEKNAISKEQLIKALIYQLDNLPPLLSILYTNKIFNTDKLLEIVQYQIEEARDLPSVLLGHTLISKKDLQKVLTLHSRQRIPLGQILVKKNFLTISDAQKLLGDFLNKFDDILSQNHDNQQPQTQNDHKVSVTVPDFSQYFENSPVEEGIIKDYLELFDENKKDSLEMSVLSWAKLFEENKTQGIKDSLRTYYRELHTLKGTARFLKAHISEFMVHHLEELLSVIQQVVTGFKKEEFDSSESIFLKGIDILWELRNELESELSEQKLWVNDDWRESLLNFIEKIGNFKEKTGEIETTVCMDDF